MVGWGLIGLLPVLGLRPACSMTADDDVGNRIIASDAEPQNWLSYGRNYQETRFSPLDQINAHNIERLGLAWFYDLDTNRGQEATPIVVDGIIFTTSAWSKVQAFDGKSGRLLWQFDPHVPGEAAVNACCDVVNRGVAYWGGKVYVGTIDGRLVALDAKNGQLVWSVLTIVPGTKNTITGAPRIIKGKVLIGNAGAEQGARGFVTAYDAVTGRQVWRFYTVPGEPGKPDGAASDAVLAKLAAPSWTGNWWTREGGLGGGTVWDSMSYDPELDLVYVGTGNASYWNRKYRSPEGGDNLFAASIIALRPDTGKYVWHYQEVPGDEWDYDATQHMVLADIKIDGAMRHVLMQAAKDGFFYVLDRATGKLISAEPYATVNWATGIDQRTGRPNIVNAAFYDKGKPWLAIPGGVGAHNWHPMSYSPVTGLVYIPVEDLPAVYASDPNFQPLPKGINIGLDPSSSEPPDDPVAFAAMLKSLKGGSLLAWDPRTQHEVWRAPHRIIPNGGVLSTKGNLVFQGDGDGNLIAYAADTGKELWSHPVGSEALAPPVAWSANGQEYVTIVVGWGGSAPLIAGAYALDRNGHVRSSKSRVLTFVIDGVVRLPVPDAQQINPPPTPKRTGDPQQIALGAWAYHRTCYTCHGLGAVSASSIPDLRHSPAAADPTVWSAIVSDGILKDSGMIGFSANFSPAQIEAIRAYIVDMANRELARPN